MSKHDMDAWTKALLRDMTIGGAINIKRAEDYVLGWNAASAYKDKRIEELEAFIEQQSKRMVKLIKEGGTDTCKWIEDSNGWTHTSCGATPFKINPYPTEEQMCGHCRKPIRISEGGGDECPSCKGNDKNSRLVMDATLGMDYECSDDWHISKGGADD